MKGVCVREREIVEKVYEPYVIVTRPNITGKKGEGARGRCLINGFFFSKGEQTEKQMQLR